MCILCPIITEDIQWIILMVYMWQALNCVALNAHGQQRDIKYVSHFLFTNGHYGILYVIFILAPANLVIHSTICSSSVTWASWCLSTIQWLKLVNYHYSYINFKMNKVVLNLYLNGSSSFVMSILILSLLPNMWCAIICYGKIFHKIILYFKLLMIYSP